MRRRRILHLESFKRAKAIAIKAVKMLVIQIKKRERLTTWYQLKRSPRLKAISLKDPKSKVETHSRKTQI